jgi:hypothetical protein
MSIGPVGSLERPGLTGSAGRVLPAGGRKFALHLKQKSPQLPVSERKLKRFWR